jgi:ABC-type multidrug transport system fused ATPase/permease subunit
VKFLPHKGNDLKVIWFFLSKYKLFFSFLIILAALIGFLETLNVAIMYPILSTGLGAATTVNQFLEFINIFIVLIPFDDTLIVYCIMFIILACFVFIFKLLFFYFSVKLTAKIVIDAKQAVFTKCIKSDYQFFVDNKQGELLYKISVAPQNIATMLNILTNLSVELILSVSIFSLLLSMSWKGTLLLIIGGAAYYYLTKYLSIRVSYKAGKKQMESGQKETVVVNEFTSGIKQIKVFETFPYWKNLFDKALHTYWKYNRKGDFWYRVPEVLLILLLYLSIGSVVIFIKLQHPSTFISTIPVIGTFAFAVLIILPKISKFGTYRMNFMTVLPNVQEVYKLLKDTTYEEIQNGEKEFEGLQSGIKLKKVSFAHKNRDVLLNNVSLEIEKDKITALVGSSGSGKSTIVNLLLRLHDVDKGGVFIDDVDIKEFDIFSFLRKVGFVSQDTFIYYASVKDNITFGGDYSDDQIIEAARLANADEFIRQLPEKYDTLVGDRGMRLSGGEKQRIAIARAMIRTPEILILDEATSSLDNISESVVQTAINKISRNCTTFIIAHRLSTIQNADVIYVLDRGQIVECGSHKELLEKKGKYWELYNIQKTNS